MFSFKKMFGKSGKDLLQTAMVTGGVFGSSAYVLADEASKLGLKECLLIFGSAVGSAIVTAIRNYIKNGMT